MLTRREFIAGISIAGMSLALQGCEEDADEAVGRDDRAREGDVPPTEENVRRYGDVIAYYDYGVVPYIGYEPTCTREEAAMAFEGMGDWVHVEGAELVPADDDMAVTLDWLPEGSQVSILNDSDPWSSEFGVVRNGPHRLGLTEKFWVNLGLDKGTDNLWLKVERYGK